MTNKTNLDPGGSNDNIDVLIIIFAMCLVIILLTGLLVHDNTLTYNEKTGEFENIKDLGWYLIISGATVASVCSIGLVIFRIFTYGKK